MSSHVSFSQLPPLAAIDTALRMVACCGQELQNVKGSMWLDGILRAVLLRDACTTTALACQANTHAKSARLYIGIDHTPDFGCRLHARQRAT